MHSFMNFQYSTFCVCSAFLFLVSVLLPQRRLKMHKRYELDSSIILSQQQWQQQLLCLPLIQTVIMGVLMLVRKLFTHEQ